LLLGFIGEPLPFLSLVGDDGLFAGLLAPNTSRERYISTEECRLRIYTYCCSSINQCHVHEVPTTAHQLESTTPHPPLTLPRSHSLTLTPSLQYLYPNFIIIYKCFSESPITVLQWIVGGSLVNGW
jgi:hypothetical protein